MRQPIPDWPPVLREEWAAEYLALSVTAFRTHVASVVKPIRLTPGRVGWLRTGLDRWLASRAGAVAPLDTANPWDDL